MTSNRSFNQIIVQLQTLNEQDENIQIRWKISSTVDFLDVLVQNNHGELKTSVFHKPAAEPYILPFTSNHPRHVHRSTFKLQLFRAVRLCSHVEDFDNKRLNIELSFLLNDYPQKFISYHLKQFLQQYGVCTLLQYPNQSLYDKLHGQLLAQPTLREKLNNQQANSYQQKIYTVNHDIQIQSTYERGCTLHFRKQLKKLWKKHYIDNNPVKRSFTIKFSTKTKKNLTQLFVKKKPPKSILKYIPTTETNTTEHKS
ncbi:unnamed protein product [Rotaria sp. Silwood2]|nr:unnamed protein product [Rotaria sp. Silwood2]CAF2840100.1 unnamed protein product [Rotaria sp. Silwood2]CAF3075240.1 unnamed protein product [Rotaria sp. Silwood2]CAF3205472.1 unnamed protein product [Rotaria sp. Silwood2]CAF4181465.1 unnamed protein product [Rotaria sp. Silwood2]